MRYSSLFRQCSLPSRLLSRCSNLNVAVIFHGSGVYDGTEIHEATSKAGVKTSIYAPDINQTRVVDHKTGSEVTEKRNALVESARIARGKVEPLQKLDPTKFDALLIPGGFGVATTLSNFAASGASCTAMSDIQRILSCFVDGQKPIGLCCIAPILAARCIPGVRITLGKETDEGGRWQNSGACSAAKEMGAQHVPKDITEVCVDEVHKVVSAPAYMCSTASVAEVFDNIGLLVENTLALARH